MVAWFANGFYTFSTNVMGKDCKIMNRIIALDNNECIWNLYTFSSLANKRESLADNGAQTFIDITSFCMLLIALIMIRISVLREVDRVKQKMGLEISDFTVQCSNMPNIGVERLRNL